MTEPKAPREDIGEDGSRPVPDPTKLTTDMGREVLEQAKEYTDLKLETIKQRLSDMDRATAVLDETVTRTPTEIQQEVGHLRELVFSRIEGILAAIERGDQALTDHVQMQVEQLKAALAATQREVAIIFEASQEAISKAEALNKERWDGNEKWRDQQNDRERTQREQTAASYASFVRREVSDAQFNELRRALSDLSDKVNKVV